MSRPLRRVVRPGMDGSGELFGPLIAAAPGRDLVPIDLADPVAFARALWFGEGL